MERKWWKESVCYQIYPKSFMDSNGDGIGDLRGIIKKLDYIKELGIDVIWICPIYKSPNADNGYDISDYQDIQGEFGTMEDFEQLLDEVHRRDMKLIMDLVVNHTSDEHPWFIESRSSIDSPKRDWYIWSEGKDEKEPNNWESIFSGSAWEYDEESKQYYLHLFDKKQPDLNWENKDVRKAIYEMVNWWMDKGINGFRVDAISHIKKHPGLPDMPNPLGKDVVEAFDMHANQKGIHSYLQELKRETFSKYDIMTVGEASGVKAEDAAPWVHEEGGAFNMVFQFEHLHLWEKEANVDFDLLTFKKILSKWQTTLHEKGWNALFIENHDKPRVVSTLGDDDVYWEESAKMLAAMYFYMQGTPFIYQGQEIGMTNARFPSIEDYDDISMKNFYRLEREKGIEHKEIMPIIWANGRDNSRTPMQWSAEKHGGFTDGQPWMKVNPNYRNINVEKQLNDPSSILHFYKKMIALRKKYECLVYGDYQLHLENHPYIFAYSRKHESGMALVLNNFSRKEQKAKLALEFATELTLVLGNYEHSRKSFEEDILLHPYETRVYITSAV